MTELLENILKSYSVYYDIKQEDVTEPFAAEAEFHTHDEQYFLVRSATISEAESNEYVYFAVEDKVDSEKLAQLDEKAWEAGLSRIHPHSSHRNSDITLVIMAEQLTEDAFAKIPKLRHYKSYRLGLHGWTNYRLVAIEHSSGRAVFNRQGRDLKKLVCNILKKTK